jgi:hypothetical protein
VIGETLTGRRLARLARLRLPPGQPGVVLGRERLPRAGPFVLALNHYHARHTLDVLAAAARAATASRPDLADQFLIVAGRRAGPAAPRHPIARLVRWLSERGRRRWAAHLLRLPWRNDGPSIGELRAWRRRLAEPVAVWWAGGVWRVRFGRPIRWSHRADLHDLQIGLAIADLLPDDLADRWRPTLRRWRALHHPEPAASAPVLPAGRP